MGFKEVSILMSVILGVSLLGHFKLNMQWDEVSIDDFLTSNSLSPFWLAMMRVGFGSVCWSTCLHLLVDPRGLTIQTYTPWGVMKQLHLKGITRFTPFTLWCWALQAWYFGLTTILSFISFYKPELLQTGSALYPYLPTIARILWVMFEISFSMAYLVCLLVTFALIPAQQKKGLPYDNFLKPLALLMHNANVIFMAMELNANKLHFVGGHVVYGCFFGAAYLAFAWRWYKLHGVFYYWFIDYHHKLCLFLYTGLISIFMLFFTTGYIMCHIVKSGWLVPHAYIGSNIPFYGLLIFTCLIMRLPRGDEWYIVTDAIQDTIEGIPYVQGEPSPRVRKRMQQVGQEVLGQGKISSNTMSNRAIDMVEEPPLLQPVSSNRASMRSNIRSKGKSKSKSPELARGRSKSPAKGSTNGSKKNAPTLKRSPSKKSASPLRKKSSKSPARRRPKN